ncbi:MAG: hypothetical protein HQL68_05625 [Magnetococcales bacterium]|nr:hypothetical protein [Magnetococcales bacterium]
MAEKNKKGKSVTDPEEIKKIFVQALLEDNPFQLQIGTQVFVYYTRFVHDPYLAEYIENGVRLLIAPLDPPIGNIKIIKSKFVTLELFTEFYLVNAKLHFLSRPNPESIELSFPTKLNIGKQKRDSIRVVIDPIWGLEVKAIRPSGISFSGIPTDLSTGGICFSTETSIPIMTKQFRLLLIIIWPSRGVEVQAKAILIKYHDKEGDIFFRAKFLFESYDEARAMEELATALQIREIKKREDLFGIKKVMDNASKANKASIAEELSEEKPEKQKSITSKKLKKFLITVKPKLKKQPSH